MCAQAIFLRRAETMELGASVGSGILEASIKSGISDTSAPKPDALKAIVLDSSFANSMDDQLPPDTFVRSSSHIEAQAQNMRADLPIAMDAMELESPSDRVQTAKVTHLMSARLSPLQISESITENDNHVCRPCASAPFNETTMTHCQEIRIEVGALALPSNQAPRQHQTGIYSI